MFYATRRARGHPRTPTTPEVQRPKGSARATLVDTRTLLLVTATIFGFVTAITMVGPLLVDLSRDLGVPLGQAGLLAAAMSLPWALGAPLTGLLSDRLGRRPLMVLALAGVGGATLAGALAPTFLALVAA